MIASTRERHQQSAPDGSLSERAASMLDSYPWTILAVPQEAIDYATSLQELRRSISGATPIQGGHRTRTVGSMDAHRTQTERTLNGHRTQTVVSL